MAARRDAAAAIVATMRDGKMTAAHYFLRGEFTSALRTVEAIRASGGEARVTIVRHDDHDGLDDDQQRALLDAAATPE